jgi:signal peptidase I
MSLIDEIDYELLFIFIALILAYGLYDTVGLALGTEIPVVAVTSGSMEPTLQRGDLIVVQGQDFSDIAVGDVIIFKTEHTGVPIIHRVIERDNTTLETKGDNNVNQVRFCVRPDGSTYPSNGSCPDGELVNAEKDITQEQVRGTAFFVIPKAGHLKLVPTCLFLESTGQVGPGNLVC